MDLTQEQKRAIAEWVRGGASLSEIQTRIRTEFDVAMTYMDVRFMVLDLGVDVRDKQPDRREVDSKIEATPEEDVSVDDWDPEPEADRAEDAGVTSLRVTVDRIMKPGSLVSGSVTFSDGVTGTWSLDQFGRLSLDTGRADYRPSQEDVRAFQVELQKTLARQGY